MPPEKPLLSGGVTVSFVAAIAFVAAISSALDGRYARAGVLTAVAAGSAVAGRVQRQRRGLRPWD
jgi:hypothetical protein